MSDPFQTKAIGVQSSAILLAAAITTSGAVTSALIQTGWIEKPPPAAVAISQPYSVKTEATITVAARRPQARTSAVSQPSPPKANTTVTKGAQVSFHAPAAAAQRSAPTTEGQVRTVSKPALLPVDPPTKPLVSPWYYLTHPTASDKHADSSKAAKKLIDWGAIARFFQWYKKPG